MSTDIEHVQTDEAHETDESRLRRFDKRIEEWLAAVRDEANERSPELLAAMATKAKDLGDYLERMAEQARAKRTTPQSPSEDDTSGAAAAQEGRDAADQTGA
jgi:hypothetical protein